jgi:hypothetical protein
VSVELTAAAGRLLERIQLYDAQGPVYLAPAAAGRYALVVCELRVNGPQAFLAAADRKSVFGLVDARLIELAVRYEPIAYRYRRPGDRPEGRRVILSLDGRRTCPSCGALDSAGGVELCTTASGRDHQARRNATVLFDQFTTRAAERKEHRS